MASTLRRLGFYELLLVPFCKMGTAVSSSADQPHLTVGAGKWRLWQGHVFDGRRQHCCSRSGFHLSLSRPTPLRDGCMLLLLSCLPLGRLAENPARACASLSPTRPFL